MSLSTQPYKGTRDFYPEDQRLLNYIMWCWTEVVESFGYEQYNAPMLEPIELYSAKTSEEIVNEQTYAFEDRGGRKVTIRPEMTPSVSRMVAARRQELSYPLRWYSIPNVWRYERPQRGRLREHWQLNVDLFGVAGIEAELEMIQIADAIMQRIGAKRTDYEIRINSRKLLDKRIRASGVKSDVASVIRIIDRYDKTPRDDIVKMLATVVDEPEKLLKSLEQDGPSAEVKQLQNRLEALGITVVTTETLARGFDYYTDIVFEVFDTDPENNRAMFGGGRYDGLVGAFGAEPVPTIGFGMGDVTLANFLQAHKLVPALSCETDLYAVLIGDVYDAAQAPITALRQADITVAVDSTDRKLDKQIKAADKKGIKHVLFVGEEELASGTYRIKNLQTGKEEALTIPEIIKQLG